MLLFPEMSHVLRASACTVPCAVLCAHAQVEAITTVEAAVANVLADAKQHMEALAPNETW